MADPSRSVPWLEWPQKMAANLFNVMETTDYAAERPYQLGLPMEPNGRGDTMRHLAWAAEMQRQHPWLAGMVLNGHEVLGMVQGQPLAEARHDLGVNRVGRAIGTRSQSRADTEAWTGEALDRLVPPPRQFSGR